MLVLTRVCLEIREVEAKKRILYSYKFSFHSEVSCELLFINTTVSSLVLHESLETSLGELFVAQSFVIKITKSSLRETKKLHIHSFMVL